MYKYSLINNSISGNTTKVCGSKVLPMKRWALFFRLAQGAYSIPYTFSAAGKLRIPNLRPHLTVN